jgi:hypothetical protein
MLLMALSGAPLVARAQTDYRNLSDGRPTATEDAYPVERYAFEFLAAGRSERASGVWSDMTVWELEHGILPNVEIGIKLPMSRLRLAGLRISGLYNANTEGPWLPALALRTDVGFPVGSLAGSETFVSVKLIATRSFGRQRVHVNAGRTFGPSGTPAAVDPVPREFGSLAVDRTLFRQSTLLLAELLAERDAPGAPVEVSATLGARFQWTPTMVLDLGVARRVREGGPDFAVTFGVSMVFGIRALMPDGGP